MTQTAASKVAKKMNQLLSYSKEKGGSDSKKYILNL
jgi:hypothetical protein